MATRQEKALFIIKKLNEFFPNTPIPLIHKDPYTLLIAVLLSAQCTDERVNKITPLLFKDHDTPQKMAQRTQLEIQNIIRPCGLSPMKSKGIYELTRILLNKHQGKVPTSFEDLEELPAVGHKTASVVLAQAFKIPTFPVDTHIHRLLYRWGMSAGKNVTQVEKDAKKIFPKSIWNKLHLQIIYYGRKFCPARQHLVNNCPICQKIGIKNRLK